MCGETGSGKTTQLPKICLGLGRDVAGLIGRTQPWRIAAKVRGFTQGELCYLIRPTLADENVLNLVTTI